MIFTKSEIAVLELFVSKILESFTIREVSRLIKKDLKIVHTSIKKLLSSGFFIKEKNGLRLNYQLNISDLAYIENLRKDEFFKKHSLIKIHIHNFLSKCDNKFFILLIFGSYALGKESKQSDIDLLAITPQKDDKFERQLKSSLSSSSTEFHVTLIDKSSFKEMLAKRDEINVVNECLNDHILLYGAEHFYALLGERDVR